MTTHHQAGSASTLSGSRQLYSLMLAVTKRTGCLLLCVQIFAASVTLAQNQPAKPAPPPPPDDPGDLGPGFPRLDQPWSNQAPKKGSKAEKTSAAKAAPAASAQAVTNPPPATVTPAPDTAAAAAPATIEPAPTDAAPPPMPRLRKNEISVSGDYLLGQGNVTMPFGFSLAQVPGLGANINETVAKPDRSSTYFGGTLSYSYGQAWYLDLGYAHGTSSGTTDILLGENTQPLPSQFSIDDNWYQAYVRYTPKRLRGQKLSGYLRAGFSYVTAELHDTTVIPAVGLYHQDDKTTDYLGNIGAGIGYTFWRTRHIRMMAQAEAEGFYGHRTQKSHEVLQEAGPGFPFPTANIDNDLYGGIGRGTLRFEYRFDSEGAYKAFIDGGMQAKFTEVGYPGGLGSFNELLWGPYVRAGLRFSF